jgi:hypothetical protein
LEKCVLQLKQCAEPSSFKDTGSEPPHLGQGNLCLTNLLCTLSILSPCKNG